MPVAAALQISLLLSGMMLAVSRLPELRAILHGLRQRQPFTPKTAQSRPAEDFLGALIICIAFFLGFALLCRAWGIDYGDNVFIARFLVYAAVGLALCFLWHKRRFAKIALSLGWGRLTACAKMVVLSYLMSLPALMAIALINVWAISAASDFLGLKIKNHQALLEAFLSTPCSPAALTAFILTAVAAAPLVEEIIMRGYLFAFLRQRLSWLPAAMINGALFALLHQDIARFLPLMALGIFFCGLREYKQTLLPSIICHALHNGLTLALAWLGDKG